MTSPIRTSGVTAVLLLQVVCGDIVTASDGRIWVALSAPGVEVDNPQHDPDDLGVERVRWFDPVVSG